MEEVSLPRKLILGPLVAAVLGGVSGFTIWWPIALVAFTAPNWNVLYASLHALTEGALFGALLSILAYLLLFLPYPPQLVLRCLPVLLVGALAGAIPGLWIGIGALFTVVLSFGFSCLVATRRIRTWLAA